MKQEARAVRGLLVLDSTLQHRFEDLRDGALLGFWQRFDPFELLLNLRRGPALATFSGLALFFADEFFEGHIERSRQRCEQCHCGTQLLRRSGESSWYSFVQTGRRNPKK